MFKIAFCTAVLYTCYDMTLRIFFSNNYNVSFKKGVFVSIVPSNFNIFATCHTV